MGKVNSKTAQRRQVTKHGMSRTRLYRIWYNMNRRCSDPTVDNYPRYGGRGITVCAEWQDFIPFRDWAFLTGYSDELTIDRIDSDGNYEPSNCRWSTTFEQSLNKRNTIVLEYKGQRKTLIDWATELSLDHTLIRGRLRRGWSVEDALSIPLNENLSHPSKL